MSLDIAATAFDQGPFDDVFQLPHITGKVMGLEDVKDFWS